MVYDWRREEQRRREADEFDRQRERKQREDTTGLA